MDLIYSYTRKQAITDGVLVDVSEMAKEAGFKFPIAVTSAVWHEYIVPPAEMEEYGQSIEGRLWDVLSMLRFAIKGAGNTSEIRYKLYFLMEPEKPAELVELKSFCHPGDEMEPVITIMLPNED